MKLTAEDCSIQTRALFIGKTSPFPSTLKVFFVVEGRN